MSLYYGISNRTERIHLKSGAKVSCMRLFVDWETIRGWMLKEGLNCAVETEPLRAYAECCFC